MELKKVHKQDWVRKPQEPYPTTERCRPPLWPPTQCTCIPSSLCYSHTTKRTRDASVLCWRPERGPASFRSGVGFLTLSNPVLFVYFFQLHPYSKRSFFRNFFPLVKQDNNKIYGACMYMCIDHTNLGNGRPFCIHPYLHSIIHFPCCGFL